MGRLSDHMSKKILILTLETFHAAGGLQRMSRTLGYSLDQLCKKNNWSLDFYCLNDHQCELMTQYLPSTNFKAFNKNKLSFTLKSIMIGMEADIVILTHINLSLIGTILRSLHPKSKIWLIAHGIEVWRPLTLWKKAMLKLADRIICVSNFTKSKVIELHDADPKKCLVLNNVLDPFIGLSTAFDKPKKLLERYRLNHSDKVIFTLTRIAASEQFKGYDQVIKAISRIKDRLPSVRYLLAGPCDESEKLRIHRLVKHYDVEENFILTGFIEEAELADHFLLADLFILPSKKEGFGIVFLEAMAFGLPIICGNVDGSTDAIRNKEMGLAIDPDNLAELEDAITTKLMHILDDDQRRAIQQQCLLHFNLNDYTSALEKLIRDEATT